MQTFGRLVHFSIPAADVHSATTFYGKLFGWKFMKMTDTYWLTEDGVGSISLEKEAPGATMPILYFSVANVDESLKSAVALGAEIVLGRTDAGDGKSFFATIRDMSGNVVGLWGKT